MNPEIVLQSYYRDAGLSPSTRYFYRVVAVDDALFEGPASGVTSASTNPPQLAGWPLRVDDFSAASPVIGDVHGHGRKTIVSAARNVFAWDADGVELRDADNNALTWGLFFGDREVYGTPTLADMDPRPGREIVVPTWDADRRFVTVLDAAGRPLPGWPQDLVPSNEALRGAHVAPVVANIDGTGAPEILLAARDGRLYAWHADGTEVADGDKNASTHGVFLDTGSPFLRCAPGVADLDPDHAGFEIVVGSTDGTLHLVDANGRPRPGWPRTTGGDGVAFGALFASGIAIADLNRDGKLEMVFTESSGRLHAMHADGSELDGYPIEALRSTGPSIVPSVAIGDLVADEALEVVAATSDGDIQIFDALGNALLQRAIVSGAGSESSPILGDVDGDREIEIVFGNEDGILNAWNLDTSAGRWLPDRHRVRDSRHPASRRCARQRSCGARRSSLEW